VLGTRPQNKSRPAPRRAGGRPGWTGRVLLIGAGSEIGQAILTALHLGPQAEVLLAGRDPARLSAAAAALPGRATAIAYDAGDPDAYQALVASAFAAGPVDLVISAVGVLTPQEAMDSEPGRAGDLLQANFTSHVTALLSIAGRMRERGQGTIVILSSVAAVRPRKANFVYGAAKAGLDAFARGLADSLHGSGVRVVLVRPGFVIGRMTAGLDPAPLSSTPDQVGQAVAAGLAGSRNLIWVPRALRPAAAILRLIPRPVWRRLRR
jgi:decaprenylphospho-beta-D-erythro-pentofuranosid-2-ulose 2-reductase